MFPLIGIANGLMLELTHPINGDKTNSVAAEVSGT
jgi:hypothetical protein